MSKYDFDGCEISILEEALVDRFKKDLNTALERLAHGFYEDAKEFMEDGNDILELHEKLNRGSEE
ncbi:hypothetical protein IJ098_00400 [Candidatus Saccharibacteria bacterium]|nr:hypothetical protein [Candidatus Saccharibacteria bacterium]